MTQETLVDTPKTTTTIPGYAGSTVLPVRTPGSDAPETRRDIGGLRRSDVLSVVGAIGASLALTTLIFARLAPFDGALGFVVVAYLLFLGSYALLVSFDEDGPAVLDRVIAVVVRSLAVLLLGSLVLVVGYTLLRGWEALVPHPNFLTDDLANTGPLEPLSQGGVLHGIVGTLEQIGIALAITVPLGLTTALALNEFPGRFSRIVRIIVEAMTALPSIIAGLFILATAILIFGVDKSGLAAGLAITVMMLPIVIRAADVVIRLVPGTLREASYALGSPRWRTALFVVLPTSRSGLVTAVILGTARGIGETSPVLLTAGFTASLNADPLTGNQVSLPLLTFKLVQSSTEADVARGFGAATTLLGLVLLLFVLARLLGGRAPGQLSRGQRLRRLRASRRDAIRFARRRTIQPLDEQPQERAAEA